MRSALVLVALSVLLAARGASAQDAGVPASADGGVVAPGSRVVEAQQHIHAAMEMFRASEYVGALHEFEMANAAAPSPEIWYNIARAHELLHQYDAAAENFRRYLRDKVDPPDRTEVEAHIRELEALAEQQSRARRRIESGATMHVEVSTAGARIYVDDALRGRSPATATWSVTPGVHEVRVEADGRQSWRASVRVHPGEPALVIADPAPLTQYRSTPASHVASIIFGALGAGALLTGVGFGVSALEAGCSGCAEQTDRATRADVSFGVGAVLGVTAAIVYFVERGANRTERVGP